MANPAASRGSERISRAEYQQHMGLLEELITGQTSSLEKALLTLSAGAFGLSIAFVTQMVPEPKVPTVMFVAWSAFGFALILTVFSFYASIKALIREREIIGEMYCPGSGSPPLSNARRRRKNERESKDDGLGYGKQHRNRWAVAVDCLNLCAVLLFALGVVALGCFAVINMV